VLIPVIALIAMILLAFVGAMAFLCFTKVFGIVFLGSPRSPQAERAKETGNLMLMPMGILSLLTIVIGIFPQYAIRLVQYPVLELVKFPQIKDFPALGVFSTLSTVGVGFVVLCGIMYVVRVWRLDRQTVYAYKTWDCGYQAGNTRMQYTGSSYAEPFLALVEPFVPVQRKVKPPVGLFPQQAGYESHAHDLVDLYAVHPVVNGINRFLGLFTWIQSGSTQKYILYGIVFLAITLAVVLSV
jgi:hydrogenase-4 component B